MSTKYTVSQMMFEDTVRAYTRLEIEAAEQKRHDPATAEELMSVVEILKSVHSKMTLGS